MSLDEWVLPIVSIGVSPTFEKLPDSSDSLFKVVSFHFFHNSCKDGWDVDVLGASIQAFSALNTL